MPILVLKLFAGQVTGWTDRRTTWRFGEHKKILLSPAPAHWFFMQVFNITILFLCPIKVVTSSTVVNMSLYKYRLYQLITTSELPKNQHASISAKTVKKNHTVIVIKSKRYISAVFVKQC